MKNTFKSYQLIYFLAIFMLVSCKSSDHKTEVPTCITSKIESLKKEAVQNPPAEVWRWVSNDQIYYYLLSPCCDQYNLLFSETCDTICAPDGGFTGKGDQKCPEFSTDMIKTLVWKDERKG